MSPAVLLLIFNRPDTTAAVMGEIKKARPAKLYIAADGPRPSRQFEKELCEKTRKIATDVDWDCEVFTLFREENIGCRRAVSGALDWFFKAEEDGIILEDDCLPSASWFLFAGEMLQRYRDDKRIMCIAANHFYGKAHQLQTSYYFSVYAHCWGWATWRRAWVMYDQEMRQWPVLRGSGFLNEVLVGNKFHAWHWRKIFDMAREGIKVDSWAYRWLFSCWAQRGLTILPARNLVVNLGVGEVGTHTQSVPRAVAVVQREELEFPLVHPDVVVRDVNVDRWESKHVYGISMASYCKHWIRHLPLIGHLMVKIRDFVKLRERC